MAQLPHISRHPSTNLTKICHIDQSYPKDSDRCSIFWLGWLMDVGRYEGVAPSMWHSQPDFGEWVGVAPSMSQKGSLMLRKNMGRNQCRRLKKYVIFRDIDGATPTHSPKSGCKCPHRWRNSLISPDIHQPTQPKYATSKYVERWDFYHLYP